MAKCGYCGYYIQYAFILYRQELALFSYHVF